jgi:hypothetical protein
MLGPLVGAGGDGKTGTSANTNLVRLAARYAEAYALSPLCIKRVAKKESDAACFNGAASAAISYYRRAGDAAGAVRTFGVASQVFGQDSSWIFLSQTPRVYHPGLRAQPWWRASDFELTRTLTEVFAKNNGRDLQSQLDHLINLREGDLRLGGTVMEEGGSEVRGLQRIFTPYIGVETESASTEEEGAGGWSEFGPLFDGLRWSRKRCLVVPLLCDAIKDYMKTHKHDDPIHSSSEICGSPSFKSNTRFTTFFDGGNENLSPTDIEDQCGSDTIITILRLRPGTHILPHCGTTNRRLIMHFALRGAEGVNFRVGDDGDSLDPSLFGPRGGWVNSYNGGDGSSIVFDDSFEHEVKHNGKADRFILLVVLKHPDT